MIPLLRIVGLGLLNLLLVSVALAAPVESEANAPAATSAFYFAQPKRLVAFGDIHGDYKVLLDVLTQKRIIDKNLNWIAGDSFVISMGDLLDRGPNSRAVMDLLIKLEAQAAEAGGRLITLNGNHEIMVTKGDYRYFSKEDIQNYRDFSPEGSDKEVLDRAFTGDSKYAKWIASRPVAVVVGKDLFIHAGVEDWIGTISLDDLNAMMREWILYYQGNRDTAPENEWITGSHGPVWTRMLAEGSIDPARLDEWLLAANAARVVVGHTITNSRRPEMHPLYRNRVLMIDTAMSIAYGGNPSAIEINELGQAYPSMLRRTLPPPPIPMNCGPNLTTRKPNVPMKTGGTLSNLFNMLTK
jgi:hypothetical protein